MREVKIGTIVTYEARGSRGQEGEGEILPAIVLKQWPDGNLMLFAFHFQGNNLIYSISLDEVQVVLAPNGQVALPENKLLSKFALK